MLTALGAIAVQVQHAHCTFLRTRAAHARRRSSAGVRSRARRGSGGGSRRRARSRLAARGRSARRCRGLWPALPCGSCCCALKPPRVAFGPLVPRAGSGTPSRRVPGGTSVGIAFVSGDFSTELYNALCCCMVAFQYTTLFGYCII